MVEHRSLMQTAAALLGADRTPAPVNQRETNRKMPMQCHEEKVAALLSAAPAQGSGSAAQP